MFHMRDDRDWSVPDVQALLAAVPVGIALIDSSGSIIDCNSALERILRLPREAMLRGDHRSRTYLRSDGTPMPPGEFSSSRAAREDRLVLGVETGVVVENGEVIWVEVSSAPLSTPGERVVVITQDVTERRRATERLRRNEADYEALFEGMRQGVFYQSADGTLFGANPAALRMFGLTLEEFLSRRSGDIEWMDVGGDGRRLPADEPPSIIALRTGKPVLDVVLGVYNASLQHAVWAVINAIPQFHPGESKPFQVFVTMHDITERMRAEEDRLRAARFTRGILDGLSENIAVVNGDGAILEVNQAWRTFGLQNGISPETRWIGMNYFTVCAEARGPSSEGADRFLEGASRVLAGDWPDFGFEYPCHSLDVERWFVVRVTRFPLPGEPMLVVAHVDVTARRRAEDSLRESELTMRSLLAHSMVGILLTSPDGRIFSANPAACRLLGRTEEEISRLSRKDVVDTQDPRVQALLKKRELHGHALGEVNLLRADGSSFPAEVASTVFETSGGMRTCMVIRDLTERKIAEGRSRDFSRRLLSIREEEKQRFSAALHHEVGSFSVGVMSRLNAAEEDLRAGNAVGALHSIDECRQLFEHSVQYLKGLAVDLRPPDLDSLGLGAALRQHIQRVNWEKDLGIRLVVESRGIDIPVEVETVLFRVAQECINNILKHSGADRVRIRLSGFRDGIRLSVADNGRGFDHSGLAARPGTPLGLLAMQEMVAAQGGVFRLRSSPGHGTRILVSIPTRRVAP
jgi:PAS domain S-box-containing protein